MATPPVASGWFNEPITKEFLEKLLLAGRARLTIIDPAPDSDEAVLHSAERQLGKIAVLARMYRYDEAAGCYLDGDGLKPGTKMVTQSINVMDAEAFKRAAMIPAGMARKHRIKALETTAADPNQSEAQRHRAWDDAGKLKALHKEEAERRREIIEGGKLAAKAIMGWQEQGGSHD